MYGSDLYKFSDSFADYEHDQGFSDRRKVSYVVGA
jgi:hypothetical protein